MNLAAEHRTAHAPWEAKTAWRAPDSSIAVLAPAGTASADNSKRDTAVARFSLGPIRGACLAGNHRMLANEHGEPTNASRKHWRRLASRAASERGAHGIFMVDTAAGIVRRGRGGR
jgi:hypothetical protein